MNEEQRIAQAQYIVNFMADVDSLTWNMGNYINLFVQLKEKYPKEEMEKDDIELDEGDKNNLIQTVQNIRGEIVRTYIKYKSLAKQVPEMKYNAKEGEPTIDDLYDMLENAPVIKKETLKEYVLALNEVFVSGIMGELLMKSHEMLSGLTR